MGGGGTTADHAPKPGDEQSTEAQTDTTQQHDLNRHSPRRRNDKQTSNLYNTPTTTNTTDRTHNFLTPPTTFFPLRPNGRHSTATTTTQLARRAAGWRRAQRALSAALAVPLQVGFCARPPLPSLPDLLTSLYIFKPK